MPSLLRPALPLVEQFHQPRFVGAERVGLARLPPPARQAVPVAACTPEGAVVKWGLLFLRPEPLDETIRVLSAPMGLTRASITYEAFREFCETRPAEVVANIAVCLIHQANYLLDRQLRQLEKDFVTGSLRERMTPIRPQYRNRMKDSDET